MGFLHEGQNAETAERTTWQLCRTSGQAGRPFPARTPGAEARIARATEAAQAESEDAGLRQPRATRRRGLALCFRAQLRDRGRVADLLDVGPAVDHADPALLEGPVERGRERGGGLH